MFWIPTGWVPYYAEWLLSFPRAPLGSISIQAWVLACGAIIVLVNDALVAVFGLIISFTAKKVSEKKRQKEVPLEAKKEL
jgi:bacteriorhodopsin